MRASQNSHRPRCCLPRQRMISANLRCVFSGKCPGHQLNGLQEVLVNVKDWAKVVLYPAYGVQHATEVHIGSGFCCAYPTVSLVSNTGSQGKLSVCKSNATRYSRISRRSPCLVGFFWKEINLEAFPDCMC